MNKIIINFKNSNKNFRGKSILLIFIGFTLLSIANLNMIPPFNNSPNFLDKTTNMDSIKQLDLESAEIGDSNNYLGKGMPIYGNEYANSTNSSQYISDFNSTQQGNGYINIPPQWTAYKLFSTVTQLSDYSNWEQNGEVDGQSPWVYEEVDPDNYNQNGSDNRENCWGYYAGPSITPSGTTSGSLFVHNGYIYDGANDPMDSSHHASFRETVYINRSSVSEARLTFDYWSNSSDHGLNYMYAEINGYIRRYYIFESGNPHHSWQHAEFSIPALEISTYINGLENINIRLGVRCALSDLQVEQLDGYVYGEVYFDNITLWIRGEPLPSQINLQLNGNNVSNNGYGKGNITLNINWKNTNSTNFKPYIAAFTSSGTNVRLTADLKVWVNKTRLSQDSNGNPYSDFVVENNKNSTWTVYYYSIIPDGYENYNFTIYYPTDWDATAAYNPTPTELLGSLVEGNGFIAVNTTYASIKSGIWKFEFTAFNYVENIWIYKNTTQTPGPNDWGESSEFFAGDYINITAKIKTDGLPLDLTKTNATLNIRLPNGNIWSSISQIKAISSHTTGMVYFDPILIPSAEPNYYVGNYSVIISWNNSISNPNDCNETGIKTDSFIVKHYTKISADKTIYSNFLEGTTEQIRIYLNDKGNNEAIQNATVYFYNLTGQLEYMNEISPGVYYADINAPNINPGNNIVTIYANHSLYQNTTVDLTFEVIVKSNLQANEYPSLTVAWSTNATIHLNFNESTSGNPINSATITSDWAGEKWVEENGAGSYTLYLNTSSFIPDNTYQTLIRAVKSGYANSTVLIQINIIKKSSDFKLFIDNQDKTIERSATAIAKNLVNISFNYFDVGNTSTIYPAIVNLTGASAQPISMNFLDNIYQYELNTEVLGVGTHTLGIIASSAFNDPISISFTLNIQSRSSSYQLYLKNQDKTIEKSISEYANENLNISVNYTDSITPSTILGANITMQGLPAGDIQINYDGASGLYTYLLNTSDLGVGTHSLTIIAIATNYETQSFSFSIEVNRRPTNYELFLQSQNKTLDKAIEAPYNTLINISLNYRDFTNSLVEGASVTLSHPNFGSIVLSFNTSNGLYYTVFNTTHLEIGVFTLTLSAYHDQYEPLSLIVTITVSNRPMGYEFYMDSFNKTLEKTIGVSTLETVNISLNLFDGLNTQPIFGANVILKGLASGDKTLILQDGIYQYQLDTTGIPLGILTLTMSASMQNYTQLSFIFTINIQKRASSLNLTLNGEDKTSIKQIEIPLRANLNISVNYYDGIFLTPIASANLVLIGIGSSELPLSFINNLYQITLNTSHLGLGTHYLTISAKSSLHLDKSMLITVVVTKIPTLINTTNPENTFNYYFTKNKTILIQISLQDLLFNQSITGASVSYTASFGNGILTDPDGDGIYTAEIPNPGIGTFSIIISAYKEGNEYNFDDLEVIINVIDDRVEIPKSVIAGLTIAISGLVTLFILYKTVLQYPKQVRKIRTIRKSIKKGKTTKILLPTFNNVIRNEIEERITKQLAKTLPKLLIKRIKQKEERRPEEMAIEPKKPVMVEKIPGKIETAEKIEVAKPESEKVESSLKPKIEISMAEKAQKATKALEKQVKSIKEAAEKEIEKIEKPKQLDFKEFKIPKVKQLPAKKKTKKTTNKKEK
ncbi:MAG: hypothetical protein ACTSRZ_06155 [Promethearchaeota archaeon]